MSAQAAWRWAAQLAAAAKKAQGVWCLVAVALAAAAMQAQAAWRWVAVAVAAAKQAPVL
jgi:hypothetical protein